MNHCSGPTFRTPFQAFRYFFGRLAGFPGRRLFPYIKHTVNHRKVLIDSASFSIFRFLFGRSRLPFGFCGFAQAVSRMKKFIQRMARFRVPGYAPGYTLGRALVPGLLALGLWGCASPPDGQVIRFGLAANPVSLDPRFATDAASTRVNRLLYHRPVDFDDRFRMVAALTDWERTGPLTYRFRIRRPVPVFRSGRPVQARDIKATYESVLDPATASPHRAGLAVIERMEVHGERALSFHLKRPDPLFPGRLVVGVMPAELLASDHPFGTRPVGSGPFALDAWPGENLLRLRRRKDGRLFEFVKVQNPTVRAMKLIRGELDLLQGDMPPELMAWLKARSDIEIMAHPGTNFVYLGFNMEDPLVGRAAIRRAVAHGINRRAIIEYVLGASARPAKAILPPHHWAGHPGLQGLAHDPDKARRILKEAGFSARNRPGIVYKTSSNPFRLRLATIIQAQLGEVGIDVELRSYDWGTFYGDIKAGRFQMYSLAWVGIKLPDIFRYTMHSDSIPPAGANRGRLRSAVADRLMESAESSADLADQAGYYRALQAYLLQELPYVPLWYEDHVAALRQGVRGYRMAADGNYDGLQWLQKEGHTGG